MTVSQTGFSDCSIGDVRISGGWENAVLSQGVQHLKPGAALEAAALLGFEDFCCTAGLVTCRAFDSSYATSPGWDMGN